MKKIFLGLLVVSFLNLSGCNLSTNQTINNHLEPEITTSTDNPEIPPSTSFYTKYVNKDFVKSESLDNITIKVWTKDGTHNFGYKPFNINWSWSINNENIDIYLDLNTVMSFRMNTLWSDRLFNFDTSLSTISGFEVSSYTAYDYIAYWGECPNAECVKEAPDSGPERKYYLTKNQFKFISINNELNHITLKTNSKWIQYAFYHGFSGSFYCDFNWE